MSWKGSQQWGGAASWGNGAPAKVGFSAGKGGNAAQGKGAAAPAPWFAVQKKTSPAMGKGAAGQKPTPPAGKPPAAILAQKTAIKPAAQATANGKVAPKTAVKAAVPAGPSVVQVKAKLAKLTADLTRQETVTKPMIEASTKAIESEKAPPATFNLMKANIDALDKQQVKINELKATIIKECAEARKGGVAAAGPAQEMSKLLIKCNQLSQQVLVILNKLKPKQMKAQSEAENKAKEVKDTAAFKAVLAKATADVNTAVNAVNAVTKQVDPLVSKPPEGEELDKKLTSIEKAAEEAAKKNEAARTDLNEKMKAVQAYAPETKKKSQADLMELQKKLGDSMRKCGVYKAFKKEFPKLVANQKAVVEVTEKLAGHEASIIKASKLAEKTDLSKDQVQEIDEALEPVQKAIRETNAIIASKARLADAATQEKFTKLKARSDELKKKVDVVTEKTKVRRDGIKSEEGIEAAQEKMQKVEEAWAACQDAEMPFLTGLEVLPEDINESALKESTEASTAATKALSDARSWVTDHLQKARLYEKVLAKATTDALTPFSTHLRELDTKVNNFRKETQERRVASAVAEILSAPDASAKSAEEAGKALALSALDGETAEGIGAAIEKVKAALTDANSQAQEARKTLETRKKDGKVPGAALGQITSGLQAGQNKLQSLKSSIANAEKLVKAKAAIPAGEQAVKEAEASAEAAMKLVPAEGVGLSKKEIESLDEACTAASKTIKAATNVVVPHLNGSPAKTREELQKLLDRKKAAQDVVNKIKTDTKERREETLSTHFLEESEAKTKAAEVSSEKLDQAEGPFLIGASHDLKKTQDILAKCEAAAVEVSLAVTASRQHSSSTLQEIKLYGTASAKKVKEGLAGMAERMKKASTRLETFNKETRDRTKESKVVEAGEKVDALEASLKLTLAAIEPFEKEGAADLSEADAAAPLATFMALEKDTRKQYNAARTFVQEREREQKGDASQLGELKKLTERIANATKELTEKKKVTAVHEQRALGTRLLTEAKEEVAGLDAEVKKGTDACAALLEKGGEDFLIASSVKTLVNALKAHMEAKELTQEALFSEAGGKNMEEQAFVKYLTDLPEAIGHDEISAFTEERKKDMFKKLSAAGKCITLEDFKAMFAQRHYCIKPVAVTNQFDVEGSETICKLEVQGATIVDVFGPTKEDATGMVRSECTVDGKKGWITMYQKKGAKFLAVASQFAQFCQDAEKAINVADRAVKKVSGALTNKISLASSSKTADNERLKEAKEEMIKLKEPIAKAQKETSELASKFSAAKSQYSLKEKAELNAHIMARNMKEASPFIEAPKSKMEALEASAKAAEDAAAPMISLIGEELEAFATPATVLEAVEKYAAEVKAKAAEVSEAVKEQQKAVSEVTPQTGGTAEAKKQLAAITARQHELANKTTKLTPILRGKCNSLVKARLDSASDGIRKQAQTKKLNPEELFDKLKDGEKIPEKAFCDLLQSLEGLSIKPEHAKLICRKIDADGVSKDAFLKYVVIYFKVLKTIAFTDSLDISVCKTLRKGEDNEIIEVLEGPVIVKYDGSEMTRVRGRGTTKSGTVTEGWLTVSGSKGTPFLEKCAKPTAPTAPAKK